MVAVVIEKSIWWMLWYCEIHWWINFFVYFTIDFLNNEGLGPGSLTTFHLQFKLLGNLRLLSTKMWWWIYLHEILHKIQSMYVDFMCRTWKWFYGWKLNYIRYYVWGIFLNCEWTLMSAMGQRSLLIGSNCQWPHIASATITVTSWWRILMTDPSIILMWYVGEPHTQPYAPVPLAGDATALARHTKKIADTR